MYSETGRGDAPHKSSKEIKDRLDVLAEIIATFGKGSKRGIDAIMEREDLKSDLEALEAAEAKRTQSPAPERGQTQPAMAPEEKKQREHMEDANEVLAEMTSELLSWSYSRPEMKQVLERLRDPKQIERFLGDKVGTEFYLQGIQDLKVRQVAERALEQFYQKANGRSYREEAA